MYYVYVLQSIKEKIYYTGFTSDLGRRIIEHNSGQQVSTKGHAPYIV